MMSSIIDYYLDHVNKYQICLVPTFEYLSIWTHCYRYHSVEIKIHLLVAPLNHVIIATTQWKRAIVLSVSQHFNLILINYYSLSF